MIKKLVRKDEDSNDVDISNLDPVELIGWKGPKPQKKLLSKEEIFRKVGLKASSIRYLEYINTDEKFDGENVKKEFLGKP
jgi:hypothetical protein